jgi:phosphomannomutase
MEINKKIFKAYDVRGIYPNEINEEIVSKIISAVVKKNRPLKIIVGHDARLSSPNLYRAAIKKLTAYKPRISTVKIGLITTPMLSFLTNWFRADLGIMITASHNPKEYNGLKIVGKNAVPISGKEIGELVN